jgi:tRNA G18 (ribose-2'-O)-methylase SpoU
MAGKVASLNSSAAAAALLYEVNRQRFSASRPDL